MCIPLSLLAALGVVAAAVPESTQPAQGGGQDRMEAYRGVRQGNMLPLNVIRERVSARFPGARVIGTDLVGTMYRVRVMRGSDVLIVDVDARSGQVLRCTGRC